MNAQLYFRLVCDTVSFCRSKDEKPLHWFFCFGTLKEYCCERTFSLDYDVDVGVLYEQCDGDALINTFQRCGFELESKILHDIDKKPLKLCFKPVTDRYKGYPSVDVYLWYPVKNLFFHTFDVNREGKQILSKYVFKGILREWVIPDPKEVEMKRTPTAFVPEADRILDINGCWKAPIFDCDGRDNFILPYNYGAMLDEWYFHWIMRKVDKGQSKSRWTYTVKSCKDLKKI